MKNLNKIFQDLFIFEMANSHQGSVEHGISIIKEMGKIARKYNVKAAVKLQYRNLDTFVHDDFKNREDVKHIPRFMSTKLTKDEFGQLVDCIHEEGLISMSTPFDEDGVSWCLDHGLNIIKIASCSAMDWPLLEEAVKAKKPLIISTGGKSIADIDKIYNFFTHKNSDFALLHCVAEYPAPDEQLQLEFIEKMKKRYPNIAIGYSGHEDPESHIVPMLAIAKGAQILERHVGLPTDKITLNSYSMNPSQADKWVESSLLAKKICCLKSENKKHISQNEVDSLQSLMRGVYCKKDILKGQSITRDDVFFAMPYQDKQTTSGEFVVGMEASQDYKANTPLYEKRKVTDVSLLRNVVHDVKGMLFEAGIALGNEFEVELSHHFGAQHFRQVGAVIIKIINREYCKKLIVMLPSQKHPTHLHKIKEETFQLLYGDLTLNIEGKEIHMDAGDIKTVFRSEKHSFSSINGAIFEEVSTTHINNDSFYEDERISILDPIERKTVLKNW